MVNTQENQSAIQQVLFALFCLMIICAGGIFILDQGREPYHAPMVPKVAAILQTELPAVSPQPVPVNDSPEKLTPATLLHKLHADPDTDVTGLIKSVVGTLDDTSTGRALESYLLWAIGTEKSDAYIDSLLNSAAAKGDFQIPLVLTTLSGRLDTPSLLNSVLVAARQAHILEPAATHPAQQHHLRLSDSLAGLSLIYYGDPLGHMRIAAANGKMAHMAEATLGQVVEIPGL